MDSQDQNSNSTSPLSPADAAAVIPQIPDPQLSTPAAAPVTPTVFPLAQVPTYSAQHVQIEGNVEAVPQETIGLGQAPSTLPVAPENLAEPVAPGILPIPADRLSAPAEVFPEDPSAIPDSSVPQQGDVAAEPAAQLPSEVAQVAQGAQLPQDPSQFPQAQQPLTPPAAEGTEGGESQKTPLEILEEILASANENPTDGAPGPDNGDSEASKASADAADADAQATAEEEAQKAAALAAETARYQQEAEQRITLAQQDLQEAAQQRVDVTQQLQSEGKHVGATVSTPEEQVFAIQQLEHDTLNQTGE